jgi:transcriptional regulator with XRE-family HTH domain
VSEICKHVAARIRAERQAAGYSQTRLGELTGIQRPIITRLESGKHTPTLETLDRVAVALGVSLATLVERRVEATALKRPAEAATFRGERPNNAS